MTIYFTNRDDFKAIHVFTDYPEGWIPESEGIDRCSICGQKAKQPIIRKDVFSLRTKRRSVLCSVKRAVR